MAPPTPPWLACADLGTSRIHLALFRGERVVRSLAMEYDAFSRRGARGLLRRRGLAGVCYVSVAPSRDAGFERKAPGAVKLQRDLRVPVGVPRGWRPGADRLCNVLAAFHRFRRPCVCVDLGTALNIEVVTGRGGLAAGLIAPGLGRMRDALDPRFEQLPRVEGLRLKLGRTTRENLEAGVGIAFSSLIREAVRQARALLGTRPVVIGTGGDAAALRRTGLFDVVDPLLTLRGVALAWRLGTRRR